MLRTLKIGFLIGAMSGVSIIFALFYPRLQFMNECIQQTGLNKTQCQCVFNHLSKIARKEHKKIKDFQLDDAEQVLQICIQSD